jgi:hypothetical protein
MFGMDVQQNRGLRRKRPENHRINLWGNYDDNINGERS